MSLTKILIVAFLMSSSLLGFAGGAKNSCRVYFGTYTGPKSKGIYTARMNLVTGELTSLALAGETPNPTFLDVDVRRRRLYAVNEIDQFEGKPSGAVSAFAIEPGTGKLTLLNQSCSEGGGPCHLLLDGKGKNILVANYGGGSVAVLPVLPDATVGKASSVVQHEGKSIHARQEKPHAHCWTLDPAQRFAFACDLGLDKVMIYRFDSAQGKLTPNDPPFFATPPGTGPRHLTFHPNGRFAYLINELNSTVTVLAYDAKHGAFLELQTLPLLPVKFKGDNISAEITVHPSGKFLYASNRGHDSITIFRIEPKQGTLTLVERQSTLGKNPRHFELDPSGKFLVVANQDSGNVVVFAINQKSGQLTATGHSLEVPAPVCVKFFERD